MGNLALISAALSSRPGDSCSHLYRQALTNTVRPTPCLFAFVFPDAVQHFHQGNKAGMTGNCSKAGRFNKQGYPFRPRFSVAQGKEPAGSGSWLA